MPSSDIDPRRRRLLGAGVALFGLAGCLDRTGTGGSGGTATTGTPWTTTPGDGVPGSEPEGWPLELRGSVLSVDVHDGDVFALVDGDETNSRLVALETDGTVRWSTRFEANVHGVGPDEPEVGDGGWSTWLNDEHIYLTTGIRDERWTVRTFDRTDGAQRWTFRTDRKLAIRAVSEDSLLVTAEEIFVPEHSHDTPAEPLTSELYRLDTASGDATNVGTLDGVAAATVVDGDVYAVAGDSLVALDGSGGTRWTYSLPGPGIELFPGPEGVVAVAERSGLLGGGNRAIGVDFDGDRTWRHDVPAANDADVVLSDDIVYSGGRAGVAAVRLDGTVVWRDDRPGGWPVVHDATDRLYTRSGTGADAATAYTASGERRWTFHPPSDNAWPASATDDAVLVTAIAGGDADEPFYTMYAVDPETGQGEVLTKLDSIFAVEPAGNRAYVAAGDQIHAYEPAPGN